SPRRSPPPSPRPSPRPLNVRTVKGTLSTTVDIVDGVEQLVVRTNGSELVPVDMGTFKALAPSDYKPGDYISMECNMMSSGVCYPTSYRTYSCSAYGLCSWSSGGSPYGDYLDTYPGFPPSFDLSQPNPLANYKERLLVMVLDYSTCGYPAAAGLNESSTRDIFLNFDIRIRLCSNGVFGLDQDALRVLVVRPNCSASITTSCAWWTMANDANTAAKSILGDDDVFNNFTHYAYILPPGLETKCLWARGGMSLLPGKQFWLQTTMLGSVNRWEVFLHMNLHNYGLWHSWENGTEFADGSTAMGGGVACPNAAESSRLGWTTPVLNGEAINSASLLPGAVVTYTVASARISGDGSFLRVMPDWLPNYYEDPNEFFLLNTAAARNLYIEFRAAGYYPEALGEAYAPKINVYEVNAIMDNGYLHYVPPIGNWALEYSYTDRKIQIISKIPTSSRAVLSSYNLVVYGGALTGQDKVKVHLCRYITNNGECPASPQ
ncbi:hypothetical protein Vretimale_65, partial [Volvox reticuliferus]